MAATEEPLLDQKLVWQEPPEIRSNFITKVYGILSAQLLVTGAIAAPFVVSPAAQAWVATKGLPLVLGATVLNLVFLLAMMCPCGCERNMRTFPLNFILLFGFTVTEGVLVGVCCAAYSAASVLTAVLCTAGLVAGLTAYAFITKSDFTGMGIYLCAACMVLFIFAMFSLFFPCPFMQKVYCCLGILVFSFYLIYDTQMIVGQGQCSLSVDDYIFGALQLYIDIVQIFMYILSLLGDRN